MYSGRPGPEWAIADVDAARLVALWSALQPARSKTIESRLGYRGCTIFDGAHRWHAFQGIAVMTSTADIEARVDTNRAFERAILATAPPGTIPETVSF